MNPHLHTKITKRIEALRTELADLEVAARVIAGLNGHSKLANMDKHIARAQRDTDDPQEEKRAIWREQARKMRVAKAAKRSKAPGPPAPNAPPPPFDLNLLPMQQLTSTQWSHKTGLTARARPLILLDLMTKAGIPTTKENYDYAYITALKWGSRPLAQSQRFRQAKLTAKGWKLTPAGAERVAEAQKILEARTT